MADSHDSQLANFWVQLASSSWASYEVKKGLKKVQLRRISYLILNNIRLHTSNTKKVGLKEGIGVILPVFKLI